MKTNMLLQNAKWWGRRVLAPLSALGMLCGAAPAATIIVQNTTDDGTGAFAVGTSVFDLFDNTDALGGNDGFGVLGRMNLSNADIASLYTAGDVAGIRSGFEPFATEFSLESTGLAGAFLETRSADTRVSQNSFGGSLIYLWIYKGPSILAASEHLIAQLGVAFPTDPESGPATTRFADLRPSEVAQLVVGNFGRFSFDYGAGSGPLPGYSTTAIGAVPEPACAVLLAFVLPLLLARRARRFG